LVSTLLAEARGAAIFLWSIQFMLESISKPYAMSHEEVARVMHVEPAKGLSKAEVRKRRKRYGDNRLRESSSRGVWRILLDQFLSVVLIVLALAAVLAFSTGQMPEGIALVAVILVNGLIGFFSEWQAVRSMDALRSKGKSQTRVRRDAKEMQVPIHDLVPGDIVFQEGGDVVPADLRLIEANNLTVDESALTGESVPVGKRAKSTAEDVPLAEQTSMLFRGTVVTAGSCEGIVVATGMETELGQIAEMAHEAGSESTPLQRRLDKLGSRLAWIVTLIAGVVAAIGMAAGRSPQLMIETAIALGAAAIPEGLPIVATIALARGMWLMARHRVLINRLTAVETLGATGIIFTDKTGTLTENRMELQRVLTPAGECRVSSDETSEFGETDGAGETDGPDETHRRVIEIGVLCSNASLAEGDDGDAEGAVGDPTEVALLRAGIEWDMQRDDLVRKRPEVREVAFDPDVMRMATIHERNGGYEVAVKGAPAAVLEVCETIVDPESDQPKSLDESERQSWLERGEQLADAGLRVLAMADKRTDNADCDPYQSLRFVGMVGLHDPPAQDVRGSIAACQGAGIRLIMVTGDQPATARAIGKEVGLVERGDASVIHGSDLGELDDVSDDQRRRILDSRIFARVSPAQKLQLLQIFRDDGRVVAMTGDGINDAPALKKADIGVAMGRRGTDAAKQAADMVLQDDKLSSVVTAVEQGRVIFGNIRKSVMFMLCTNVAEIIAVALATAVGLPMPLRPLQILFLNVVTDVFPALALGVGKGDSMVMQQPPRDAEESILTRRHWGAISGWSVVIAICVLAALVTAKYYLELDNTTAVTISFLTLGLSKLWFVLNLRDGKQSIFNNEIVRNPWIWGALGTCVVLLLTAVYLPGLSDVLRTQSPTATGWGLALGLSLVPVFVGEAIRWNKSRS
jgi:Ca2+-transporting ATPase